MKRKLRKRAREEVTCVPTLCNEALVEFSTQPDHSNVALTLPTYSTFKSSMYRTPLHSLKQELHEIDLTGRERSHFDLFYRLFFLQTPCSICFVILR